MAISEKSDELVVVAELDVPGETSRQARVLSVWLLCLAIAVTASVLRRPYIPPTRRGSAESEEIMQRYRRDNFALAAGLGLILPGLWTWWMTQRRRRGGPHARGIQVAVTAGGEIRLWGRGYGQRLQLAGAGVSERLVDVYTGRLGAWRQRRMSIRAAVPTAGMPGEIELATVAIDDDADLDLPLVGGEGDCIELDRDAYLNLLRLVTRRARHDMTARSDGA